ncbi:MAG TPA: hypothetical protein VF883_16855 [Thermoanaerobaculia bacterium]
MPGVVALTATRNSLAASLSWTAPSSGKAPITSYVIERSVNDLGFRTLATATGTATKYEDGTAIDERSTYSVGIAINGPRADAVTMTPTSSPEEVGVIFFAPTRT